MARFPLRSFQDVATRRHMTTTGRCPIPASLPHNHALLQDSIRPNKSKGVKIVRERLAQLPPDCAFGSVLSLHRAIVGSGVAGEALEQSLVREHGSMRAVLLRVIDPHVQVGAWHAVPDWDPVAVERHDSLPRLSHVALANHAVARRGGEIGDDEAEVNDVAAFVTAWGDEERGVGREGGRGKGTKSEWLH